MTIVGSKNPSSDCSCLISLQIVTFVNGLLAIVVKVGTIIFLGFSDSLIHISVIAPNGNNLQFTENTYLLYTISVCLLV